MPLTPTDVANKQFRIAFRGYSLDEVDAFLDEVETELTRLLRDNAELRTKPAAMPPAVVAEASSGSQVVAPPAPRAEAPLGGMEGQEAALRTLLLAQRTADEAIAEARAEADDIVTAARTEAEQTLSSARSEADSTLSSARAEAERTLSEARSRAARLDEEVAAKIHAATGDLEARRIALEGRIDELRAFEREYRTRLKAYLEAQLRDLGSGAGHDDAGAGVPAGARTAAVGLTPGTAAGVRGQAGTPGAGDRDGGRDSAPAPAPAPVPASAQDAPAGPPREADAPAGVRAAPPLTTGGGAVGPFTVLPAGDAAGRDDADAPADR